MLRSSAQGSAIEVALANAPAAVGSANVLGPALVRPWERFKTLIVAGIGGPLVTADALTITLKMRRIGTSTFDTVVEPDGSTPVRFTAAKTANAGALEDGAVFGTIDLTRLRRPNESFEYDAVALNVINTNNTTPGIAGWIFILADPYNLPTNGDDDLLEKQLYDVNNLP